jgi:DNA-binding transcriptional LysR family regulator
MTSNNAESLLIAALGGMGIVLFPDWLIGDRLQRGELVALLPEMECAINTEQLNIAAIYPNARHPPLNVRAVIDYYVALWYAAVLANVRDYAPSSLRIISAPALSAFSLPLAT